MKPRLIRLCISFIIADVILVGASNAAGRFDPEDAVGIWLFDEGKGKSVKDFTGHDNDGEIMNGAKWINGKFGMALSFDGSNQRVEINNPVNLPEMNHSISVWVNPGKPQKQYANIVGNHVAPFTGYVIQQNADNLNSFLLQFRRWRSMVRSEYRHHPIERGNLATSGDRKRKRHNDALFER